MISHVILPPSFRPGGSCGADGVLGDDLVGGDLSMTNVCALRERQDPAFV